MRRYILKRIAYMIIILFATIVLLFTLMEFVPGDPALVIMGENATEESIRAIHEKWGLDAPYIVRLGKYLGNLLRGDMGRSYITQQPIADPLMARLPLTLTIAFFGVFMGTLLGIFAGIISAVKQYSALDRIVTGISLFGASAPSFWLAMLFVLIFAIRLRWLPASGSYTFKHWILPVTTIGLMSSAGICRMTRSSMLEVIRMDYIRTARAKGQTQFKVIVKHALRNAFIPILTQVGSTFCGFLGGTVLVESVYAIPGLGDYIITAVKQKDVPVVLSGVAVVCMMCTIVNLIIDIAYAFIDPRIQSIYSGKGRQKKKVEA